MRKLCHFVPSDLHPARQIASGEILGHISGLGHQDLVSPPHTVVRQPQMWAAYWCWRFAAPFLGCMARDSPNQHNRTLNNTKNLKETYKNIYGICLMFFSYCWATVNVVDNLQSTFLPKVAWHQQEWQMVYQNWKDPTLENFPSEKLCLYFTIVLRFTDTMNTRLK